MYVAFLAIQIFTQSLSLLKFTTVELSIEIYEANVVDLEYSLFPLRGS